MIHPYCIRPGAAPAPPPELTGVEAASVHLYESEALGAWFSEVEEAPHPGAENLRSHDDVIRTALASSTPLPVRFGARLADVKALARMLEEGEEGYLRVLERVAGCVEIGIRLGPVAGADDDEPAMPSAPGGSGRAHMERLHAERRRGLQRRREGERRLHPVLAALPEPVERWNGVTDDGWVDAALLVRKEDIPRFREAFAAARSAADAPLSMSGPWPPYSFTRPQADEH